MFYQGSLTDGLSLAIQEQKLVGIFVRDDGPESATWEVDWLQSGWVATLLEQKAVLLRLEAGSTEAGFLAAFCTLDKVPAFVAIQNGQLQEHLSSGISKDDFVNRLRKLLGAPPIAGSASSTPTNQPTSPPATSQAHSSAERAPPSSAPTVTPSPASISPPTSKTKGKQKATEPTQEPQPATATATAAQDDARYALRKKKLEEKEELARIKSRIEADKAERKAQAEARKAAREQQKLQSSPTTSTPTPNFQAPSTRGSRSTTVHLNIRLFSGLTIRSAFPRTATLETDVRPWIDREAASRADLEIPRDTLPPYIFKQILAPLPSRELTAGDESQALGDIELAPSATLVLVPVKGYKEAYADGAGGIVSGATGVATAIVGGVLGLAGSALGFVGSTIGAVVGGGGEVTGSEQRPGGQQAGRALGDAQQEQEQEQGVRVRTLADQRAREPRSQQLYNGNQLNFEDRDEEPAR